MSNVEFHCPQCKKRISLSDSLAGRASTCPKCQEWLVVPTASEPNLSAAEPILDALVEQDGEPGLAPADGGRGHDRRGNVALGGWSCLVIALLLMVFAQPAFFVYLPLVVVAFILGIVTMAKGHAIHGQLLLIATLVLPVLVAMKFLGMELSQIPHIDQWLKVPAAESEAVAEEVAEEDDKSPEEQASVATSESMEETPAEPVEWAAQETTMEQTVLEVENDWDQNMPDQEPNWEDRADYWADQYLGRFVAPRAGMYVKLKLQSGGGAEGTLRAIGPESVTLQVPRGWVTYEKERMASDSRRHFFAEDFAQYYAAKKVRSEQEQIQSRRGTSGDEMSSRL